MLVLLLEVNGISLSGASHGDAKRALMNAGTSVSLLVVENPAGNEQFTLEADRLEAYADIYALPPMAPNAELEIPEVRIACLVCVCGPWWPAACSPSVLMDMPSTDHVQNMGQDP